MPLSKSLKGSFCSFTAMISVQNSYEYYKLTEELNYLKYSQNLLNYRDLFVATSTPGNNFRNCSKFHLNYPKEYETSWKRFIWDMKVRLPHRSNRYEPRLLDEIWNENDCGWFSPTFQSSLAKADNFKMIWNIEVNYRFARWCLNGADIETFFQKDHSLLRGKGNVNVELNIFLNSVPYSLSFFHYARLCRKKWIRRFTRSRYSEKRS